jgi:hypothetical protein
LENPRYTGYAVFGRWTNRVVRSRMPAHPAIVSVAEITQAQLRRQAQAATRDRSYLLRGLVRCELCQRKMQGGSNGKRVLYRCIARQLAPGSAALTDHPKTINLGEKA